MWQHKGQIIAEYGYNSEVSGNVIKVLVFEIERSIDSYNYQGYSTQKMEANAC